MDIICYVCRGFYITRYFMKIGNKTINGGIIEEISGNSVVIRNPNILVEGLYVMPYDKVKLMEEKMYTRQEVNDIARRCLEVGLLRGNECSEGTFERGGDNTLLVVERMFKRWIKKLL